MMTRVWAPDAQSVALVTEAGTAPMTPLWGRRAEPSRDATGGAGALMSSAAGSRGAGTTTNGALEPLTYGWWEGPALEAGQRYGFSLDGGDPLPDPRSRFQPGGVHGPSEWVDPAAFHFSPFTSSNALGAVFYELHVGTFTPEGTFAAAATKLPYLARLGIQYVEIMPVAPTPGTRNWGYDGVDIFAVNATYGGPAGFAAFIEAAHRAGIGVCLDVVYNHFGPDGNYLHPFGPYFTNRHKSPWGEGINFDGSPEVRRYFIDNALQWIRDYHVDALRLDAVHEMVDSSPRHILADIADAVHDFGRRAHRRVALIAESDRNDPLTVTPTAEGGLGMDAQWADDLHHALHVYLTGEHHAYYGDFALPGALEKAARHVFVHDGNFSSFRGRPWGAPVSPRMDSRRFVTFTQNHDQVGNRALGDRPDLCPAQQAVGLALTLLSPFTPMLFMGEEWGATTPFLFFTDYAGELGRSVDEGRRKEFKDWGWETAEHIPAPQALSTFTASKLDWTEAGGELADFTRTLISLRHSDFSSADREDSEIVRLGSAGYYRRGQNYVVFSVAGAATVSLPAAGLRVAAAFGAPTLAGSTVTFTGPGVAVLVA